MNTTTIDDLIAKLGKLSAAGYGDETVSVPVVGPKRTPIAAMLARAEDVATRVARQVECSISVWDFLDLLEATRPETPVYLTLDGGRSVQVDGRGFTRDESGHYYALHPTPTTGAERCTAKSLAEELSGVLMHEDLESRKEIRLIVARRAGPVSDRILALRADGVVDPYATGGRGAGPFMLNAVTIPADD